MAPLRIVYLTAGAGGMFCGSCMHDNVVAKTLMRQGHEAILVPLYTPILTDQSNASEDFLFFGGISVYLQQLSPVFRWLPRIVDKYLNSPKLVRWFASKASATSAKKLGALTISMLQGKDGKQKKEVLKLANWLKKIEPDAIIFSNMLISGCLSTLENSLPGTQLAVMLQGDDIFIESLPEPYRAQAIEEMRLLARTVDVFLVHSEDYQQRMGELLRVGSERIAICPLSIDARDLLKIEHNPSPSRLASVGYLARIAPEKGLHLLVDAFIQLKQAGRIPGVKLQIAGWLGKQHQRYWRELQKRLHRAKLNNDFHFWGTIDRSQKIEFLSSIDLLSVPTVYRDPKGLYALEAMASGVPYLLPAHGAFPELHQRANAGRLHTPESVDDLARHLGEMLEDIETTRSMHQQCRKYVREQASPEKEAAALLKAIAPD
jgi:glycosyltransferase involved in cell wall biosynthesis